MLASDQYLQKRLTGEGERLPSDILEMSKILDIKGYKIVTIYTDKAFDSLNHNFVMRCLKRWSL